MNYQGLSPALLWSATTRTLTGFGTALLLGGAVNQSLAASGSISFSPASNTSRQLTGGAKAGAAGTAVFQLGDGTNLFQISSIAATQTGTVSIVNTTTALIVFLKNNDAANAATYSYVTSDWVQ